MAARRVTAVAHRGMPYRARENTLPALRAAVAAGADAVEVDVRLTRDGAPVVLHDRTLERLWGVDVALAGVTAAELVTRTGGGVPSLPAALAELRPVRTLIDLPDPAAVPATVRTVRECAAADRVYYCGGPAAMRLVRRADPAAEIALTWHRAAPVRPSLLADVRPRWLNLRFGLVRAELVARCRADGLLVSAWTADTRRTMRRLLHAGVDAVTTNRLEVLTALRDGPEGARPAAARLG
ncbi:glycerophosphodiester phosphodiesterase [Streptomyces sp. JJ36]|uniref:glycerophosphodiester phosphodiesterase n=1 Tax=Streptomyces sp. JJ36 TaxID=2736645 RepID=UPI001F3CD8F7|nr:glycerophosphodiester phosphodiesterase [Streptomyces sp. JJ36]MCF6523251.1 glycerophosphodiester phosphodiesterase [Streptomyces sp. JJ36]